MAFADAVFDGACSLRVDEVGSLKEAVAVARDAIPVTIAPLAEALGGLNPGVLVDARIRKHEVPECSCGWPR